MNDNTIKFVVPEDSSEEMKTRWLVHPVHLS